MEQPYYIPPTERTFLHLEKPLIFFNLETSGTNPFTDRIVERCAITLYPDGTREEWYHLINPTHPISPGASAVYGITDKSPVDNDQAWQRHHTLYHHQSRE